MNKNELVDALSVDAGINKQTARRALDALFGDHGIITTEIVNGGRVTLQGFGTFSRGVRQGRRSRLPGSSEIVQTSSRKVARFHAGKALSELVRG